MSVLKFGIFGAAEEGLSSTLPRSMGRFRAESVLSQAGLKTWKLYESVPDSHDLRR